MKGSEKRAFAFLISLIAITVTILAFLLFPRDSDHQPTEIPQIRIVRIQFLEDGITSKDLGLQPGTFKRSRSKPFANGFTYHVHTQRGELIAQGNFPDPRIVYYDYPKDDSGQLQGGKVEMSHAVFDIRLPNAKDVMILEVTDSGTGKKLLTTELPAL